jgi:hypothetical protein
MLYQKEKFIFANFTVRKRHFVDQPVIHCLCAQHNRFGLQLEDIYWKHAACNKWIKMESNNFLKNAELLNFTSKRVGLADFQGDEIYFDFKIFSTIGNYYYEMMDNAWMDQFWTAATEQKLTDVDIFVGTDKLMEAHRVILSARSPVLNESFNKTNDTGKSVLTFDGEFDVVVVENFLNFLYTGSLETFASKSIVNYKQLFKLATLYEVETLKNICQVANNVPVVQDFPNSLMKLIGLSN